MYINGTLGAIPSQDLDGLLEMNVVVGFCRSSGWVVLSKDEIRNKRVDEAGSWRDRKSNRLLLTLK
jgi:hypothetical protein